MSALLLEVTAVKVSGRARTTEDGVTDVEAASFAALFSPLLLVVCSTPIKIIPVHTATQNAAIHIRRV